MKDFNVYIKDLLLVAKHWRQVVRFLHWSHSDRTQSFVLKTDRKWHHHKDSNFYTLVFRNRIESCERSSSNHFLSKETVHVLILITSLISTFNHNAFQSSYYDENNNMWRRQQLAVSNVYHNKKKRKTNTVCLDSTCLGEAAAYYVEESKPQHIM